MRRDDRARLLCEHLEKRGATVTTTRRGHLRVAGPNGVAVVASKLGDRRTWQNTLMTIAHRAGVDVRPVLRGAR